MMYVSQYFIFENGTEESRNPLSHIVSCLWSHIGFAQQTLLASVFCLLFQAAIDAATSTFWLYPEVAILAASSYGSGHNTAPFIWPSLVARAACVQTALNPSLSLSIYLSVYLSIHPSIYPSFYLFVYLSTYICYAYEAITQYVYTPMVCILYVFMYAYLKQSADNLFPPQ